QDGRGITCFAPGGVDARPLDRGNAPPEQHTILFVFKTDLLLVLFFVIPTDASRCLLERMTQRGREAIQCLFSAVIAHEKALRLALLEFLDVAPYGLIPMIAHVGHNCSNCRLDLFEIGVATASQS